MSRVVIAVSPERLARDLSWMMAQGLHLFMDVVTCGLWIPVHIRSNRKIRRALDGTRIYTTPNKAWYGVSPYGVPIYWNGRVWVEVPR